MGRLINEDEVNDFFFELTRCVDFDYEWVKEVISKVPTVDAIPKDQYEQQLKADMVAMLTEIQSEIMEQALDKDENPEHTVEIICHNTGLHKGRDLIQEKINKLKVE